MRKIPSEEFKKIKVYTEEERIADEEQHEFLIKLNEESIEKMKKMPPEYFEEQNKIYQRHIDWEKIFKEYNHLGIIIP